MKCPMFGNEIGEKVKFCRFCGAEQEKKSKNGILVLAVVVIGIAVVGLGVTTCLLFQMNRGESINTEAYAGANEQVEAIVGTEISSDVDSSYAAETNEAVVDITGYGTDYELLYRSYVKDVLEPKFGMADQAPFVQMWRQTMEWADYTVGSDEKNRGILSIGYADLSCDGIDEMIVLVSERVKEPEYHASDDVGYDTSYYEFHDAVSVYIYGIRNHQVEQLLTKSDIDIIRTYPLSNAYGCTCKYMTVTREGKNYLLMVSFTDYWYGGNDLRYVLVGEENGQVKCLAGRCFGDGNISDLITKADVTTPALPEAENVPLDEEFYHSYTQPLEDREIELGLLSSYFDGLYTSYNPDNIEDRNEYPAFYDYPDDADMIMDLQCRNIADLVPDFDTIDYDGHLYAFMCYVLSEDQINSDKITSVNWNNMISTYLVEHRTVTDLPDAQIEDEVKRIRQVWTVNRESVSNNIFDKVEPQKGIRLYNQNGELKMIEVDKNVFDEYSRIFQIENGKLTFAYYESGAAQIRLYFHEESLFRWIQTNAGSDAVIHDKERDNSQFTANEQMALNDVKKLLN